MGDIADDLYDQMVERGQFHINARPAPICHACKQQCYWAERRGKWVLMTAGSKHVCQPQDLNNQATQGFTG